jgi:hypothetical protein
MQNDGPRPPGPPGEGFGGIYPLRVTSATRRTLLTW